MEKQQTIELAGQKAKDCEYTYHGCSQCVLLAIQDVFDLDADLVFKSSSGLAGGIGRMHSVCGALLAGALALGLKYGRERAELADTEKLFKSMEYVEKLYRRFEKEFGSVMCRDIREKLLGEYIDTKIPEEYQRAVQLGLYEKCSDLASQTARMVAELMLE
ncbi:MAG: C-GCAxxG-C-C family protein [Pseudomonadota bacterium]